MATCNLYFYRCNITPDKNRVYDQYQNFEVLDAMYGATKMYEKLNFQYQKLSLHMNIKVSFEQRVQYSQSVNYLKLVDTTNYNVIYFFITKFEWVAQNTIRCELYMDTMQTYKAIIENYITSSTFVMREHSDRASYDEDTQTYTRIISKTDEGVGVVSQELQLHGSLEINNSLQRHKGYIGYVKNIEGSSDHPSPISTIIFADTSFDIINNPTLPDAYVEFLTYSALRSAITYKYSALVISQLDSPAFKYQFGTDTAVSPFGTTKEINGETCTCRAIYLYLNDNNAVEIVLLYYSGERYPYTFAGVSLPIVETNYPLKLYNIIYARRAENYQLFDASYSHINNILNDNQTIIYQVGTSFNQEELATPDTFDFSDSFLMKVVELPFFPPIFRSQLSTARMEAILPTGYYYNFHYKALQKSSVQDDFPAVPYTSVPIGINSTFTNVGTSLVAKKIDNESKLYNSSFYTCKFVYGADAKELKLENLSIDTISVIGYAPKNMSSTLLFDFQLTTSTYKGLDDYFEYLTTTRNNEVPIYNSGYLDYIRLQYSTDKANLKQSQDQKIASLAGGITTSVASTASSIISGTMFGAATGSPIGAVAGGIAGGIIGLVSSSVTTGLSINNTINSIAQENRNYSSKLNALIAQNVSLSGNADIDILDKMNRNSLNIYLYQAPDHIRQQLFDKFYYTGYAVGYRKLPDFTSRRLFNFVQCVPVFDNSSLRISKEYLDDIVNRFSQGVTFMHVYDYQNSKAYYDETQQYENMEVSLIS